MSVVDVYFMLSLLLEIFLLFFFFNDTATTEIYTLSLHDALPICAAGRGVVRRARDAWSQTRCGDAFRDPRRTARLAPERAHGVRRVLGAVHWARAGRTARRLSEDAARTSDAAQRRRARRRAQ